SHLPAAPEEPGAESSDAQRRRKKRTGLRVPSDNVPRPEGRSTGRTSSPGEVAAAPVQAPVETVPAVVTIMPARPPASPSTPSVLPASTPPPPATPQAGVTARSNTEDLEVDVE